MDRRGYTKDQRGFTLVLALVTMLAMTVIAISVISNMNTDMYVARNEREAKLAFQLAEAGIQEGMARLRLPEVNAKYSGELDTDAGYRTITWNDNNALGKDFGYNYGGDANSFGNLNYTVTVRYLTENNSEGLCDDNEVSPNNSGNSVVPPASCSATTPEVVMYGQDFGLTSDATLISYGIQPVYILTSTGTAGTTQTSSRTIEAYIGGANLDLDTGGAINTNSCIDIAGGSYTITGPALQDVACASCEVGAGACTDKAAPDNMNEYLGLNIAEVMAMSDELHYCKGANCGDPGDDIPSSGKIDDVVQDWGDAAGDTYSRQIYIDNSGGKQVAISGNFAGRGLLIVTGDLKLSGNFQWEGLMYVFGELTISGGGGALNVTGAVMSGSTTNINGSITLTYDQDTLDEVAKENSSTALLVWKKL